MDLKGAGNSDGFGLRNQLHYSRTATLPHNTTKHKQKQERQREKENTNSNIHTPIRTEVRGRRRRDV